MRNISLRNVSFTYPNGFEAVHNVNLDISAGERVAILGQNGAGKTTTVKLINNLIKPSRGDVLVGEMNTKNFTTAQISRIVGYVFQNPDDQIFHATVQEEIEYGPRVALGLSDNDVLARCENALRIVGLWEYKHINPFDLPLSIRKFVAIAAIVAINPDIYIFDEPTAGQDLVGTERLASIISNLNSERKTIITITHDIEFAAKEFNRIVVMSNKQIIKDGSAQEVFYDEDIIAEAKLQPPYVARIASLFNLRKEIMTAEQFYEALK